MARTEYRQVPPIRDLLVRGHEAGMNIRLFGECATRVGPYMFAVVEESVGGRGSDGCKQDPVGNGNGCRNK
jgi:hypothetical protein